MIYHRSILCIPLVLLSVALYFGVGNSGHILCLLAPAAVLKIHTEVGTLIHLMFAVSLQVLAQGGW